MFSVLSYLIVGLVEATYFCFSIDKFESKIFKKLFYDTENIEFSYIIFGTLTSIVLAILLSVFHNYKWFNVFARRLKVTKSFGEDDVWCDFQNLPMEQKNNGWVIIRDHKYNLSYFGYINRWSDSNRERELLLSNVTVSTNDSGKELYDMDQMYICRDKYELSIEVPFNNKK